MTDQTNARGHTGEIAAAVQAERERCLKIIRNHLDGIGRNHEGTTSAYLQAQLEHTSRHIHDIRQRIESGETL
jgi:hypothetical protein